DASQTANPLIRKVPAYPVWTTLVSVVRECKLRLLHQVIVRLIEISDGAVRIAEGQVNTRRIRWRSAGRDRECRHVILCERIGVWSAVVRILIVNLVFE